MLRLSLAAALIGTATNPNEAQAARTVAAKPISLPELPPKPAKDIAAKLFPGFVQTEVRTSGATIPVLHKGDGPPVLLLHGYPETHVTWHKVAPGLAERFSVYVPDLRGYGDSSRPTEGNRHVNYSFRAMALDQIVTMLGMNSSLSDPTIGVLASRTGCVSISPKTSQRFVSWTSPRR
jgi:hypothetical protein